MSKQEFLEINSLTIQEIPENVSLMLTQAIKSQDADLVEYAVLILFVYDAFSDVTNELLGQLLPCSWHCKHEDIALIMGMQKDVRTIDWLFEATTQRYNYLNYDDTLQFPRKCIKALSAIGNQDAIDRLKMLSQNDNEFIKQYATKELGYLHAL